MGIWAVIILLALIGFILCMFYLSLRLSHFPFIMNVAGGRKKLAMLFSLLAIFGVNVILYFTLNPINTVICIAHLTAFWALSELVFSLIRRFAHKQVPPYVPGLCGIIVTVIYMLIASYLCLNVWEKDYTLESPKLKGDLRIVQFADSHIGSTFHADGLLNYVHRINELNPDVVLITGDYVDDGTTREDMINSCKALSELKTNYGVFFSYGNHDKGYFGDEAKGWNNDDLMENLAANGVTVLQDEAVLIDDRFYIVGRQDRSESDRGAGRKTIAQLMEDLDPDIYSVVLDHQPCEYADIAKAGAGLVLGGHTHGGQFFPFNQMGVLTKQYDRSYGYERRDQTDFIVTSGIGDWELIFKTGCRSEFVVVDVHGTA